ncbi:hypothetical protein D9X30_4169 [Cupriavidus sp. U2]|nr:hypothetical protein D9X30_4169 [Cupriavidus sp. U2]
MIGALVGPTVRPTHGVMRDVGSHGASRSGSQDGKAHCAAVSIPAPALMIPRCPLISFVA